MPETPLHLTAESQAMLDDIAKADGSLRYYESDLPYSRESEMEAKKVGLVSEELALPAKSRR